MKSIRTSAMAVSFFLLVCGTLLPSSLAAQKTPPGTPASRNPAKSAPGKHGRHGCLNQAGIPESAIEKRKTIQQNTRTQIEGVCADSSLSAQQKKQKIHELRKSAEEQMTGLLSPQQMEALRQCQREHSGGGHGGGHHGGGSGPCGHIQ